MTWIAVRCPQYHSEQSACATRLEAPSGVYAQSHERGASLSFAAISPSTADGGGPLNSGVTPGSTTTLGAST
jgi:hypothetical protein